MNQSKKQKFNRIIEKILSKLSINYPPVNVDFIAKSFNIELKTTAYTGKESISGVLVREGEKVIIGVNSLDRETRQRFTLAHELAHFLLHRGNQIFIDRKYRVNFRDQRSGEGTDKEEIEANTFASMLLIPDKFILDDLKEFDIDLFDEDDVSMLANRYDVSIQAMSLRLSKIESYYH